MLDRIEFLLGEGFAAFRRNGLMTLAAVSTAAVALFLLGGLGYSYLRLRDYAETLSSKFTMQAFLRDGTPRADISKTAEAIRAMKGVEEVRWIPRDTAWQKWQREDPEVTAGLENPFPDSLKVRLKDVDQTEAVVAAIERLPAIHPTDGVQYLANDQKVLSASMRFVRWLGAVLGGLCLITAGILIYNAIRLTVVARRREIRIMQLVGASFPTIRIPFLIEGALQGAFGGMLAALLMLAVHAYLGFRLSDFSALDKIGDFPLWTALAILMTAGAAFGAACSAIAVRNPLKLGGTGV